MRRALGSHALTAMGAIVAVACGQAVAPVAPPPVTVPISIPHPSASASPARGPAEPDPARAAEARRKVQQMLEKVSRLRGLPIRGEVASVVLDRAAILARIRAHVDKEIPLEAVESEGELLAALELVPPDYDFVEGTYKLIQGRIAGFYEPKDHTMYLVDDLTDEEAIETLAHELDHALQDQSFAIGKLIEYVPGDGDRSAAAHSVIEGDATSAMLDVTVGSAFRVSAQALRMLMAASNAASEVGKTTPHVLLASLGAPYTDGFAFVQQRRDAGGWPAVDAAIRTLPASTEQILHPDKYASQEPPIAVAVPTFAALGPGFRHVIDDVVGEQSLLLMLDEWVPHARAEIGAAGWGGDRYVIVRKDDPAQGRTIAFGWRAVMDTEKDAVELGDILAERFGKKCRERSTVGPIVWKRRGKDLALAAGPYVRQGTRVSSAGNCALATTWLDELMGAPVTMGDTPMPPAPKTTR
jgi:hypothetical protein